ncbi:hypothetical protein [Thaumasiovibrio sp. DFM-14]|uniref:hypothetical protein n=1 Tax=Thaumasiovibrio sp. DFM-14 TaxID=3384792 RepID=UPI0039A026C0
MKKILIAATPEVLTGFFQNGLHIDYPIYCQFCYQDAKFPLASDCKNMKPIQFLNGTLAATQVGTTPSMSRQDNTRAKRKLTLNQTTPR